MGRDGLPRAIEKAENRWISLARRSIAGRLEDEAPSKGAAIAYYAVFFIAPLLFLVISIAGLFFRRRRGARRDVRPGRRPHGRQRRRGGPRDAGARVAA